MEILVVSTTTTLTSTGYSTLVRKFLAKHVKRSSTINKRKFQTLSEMNFLQDSRK